MNQPQWFQQWFEQTVDQFNSPNTPDQSTEPHYLLNSVLITINWIHRVQPPSTAMVQLNGGLGTSMGCDGPKSLIECDSRVDRF